MGGPETGAHLARATNSKAILGPPAGKSYHLRSGNPNGIAALSRGLRGARYPGLAVKGACNPERIASQKEEAARRCKPFRLEDPLGHAYPG